MRSDIWFLSVQLQWKDDLVLVKDGKVEHVVSREGSRGLLPEIHSMTPVCVSTIDMEAVKITGSNIAGYGQTVLCRSQGILIGLTRLRGVVLLIHTLTVFLCQYWASHDCLLGLSQALLVCHLFTS